MTRQFDNQAGRPRRRAFTIVELIVVVVVIALILGLALPGLNSMTNDARFSAAVQSISGALNRARIESLADMNMTAVRFVRGDWDAEGGGETATLRDRQHVVGFRYKLNSQDSGDSSKVTFDERFERRPDSEAVVLPADIWAAPVEALEPAHVAILDGPIGSFSLMESGNETDFLRSDDFLIVFDPNSGVRGSGSISNPTRFPLLGYNALTKEEDPKINRFNYAGIVLYRREVFAALGENASGADRQALLQRMGRPYYVRRFGGGLVMGTP